MNELVSVFFYFDINKRALKWNGFTYTGINTDYYTMGKRIT